MVLKRGGESIPVVQVDEKIWLVKLDGEDFFLIQRSVVDSLTKKIAIKSAIIEHHEKVIATQDMLLKQYEAFEKAAREHIETQKALITTADSLFRGYKSLYKDAKKLLGLSNYAILFNVGLVDPPGGSWRPVGAVGVGINRWQAQYQFGSDFRGVLVGVRWSFGF
ncbi:MAG: hypothetical protein D6814_00850 [Calditrichaeota bacterium]|nr:MAG: hypothetical protein D6814_00850 [Calditrichota bacterium]